MLSSRYVHLHEALGLGAMWLQQGAKILPLAAMETPPMGQQTPKPTLTIPTGASHKRQQPPMSHARAAAMATVGAYGQKESVSHQDKHEAAAPIAPAVITPLSNTLSPAPTQPVALMVISICPAPEDYAAGQLFSGEVGELLNKMLAAIQLQAYQVYKTSWLDTVIFTANPSEAELSAAQPRLNEELTLAAPQAILFLGQFFRQTEHLARIQAFCQDIPFFTVPHPARLLRQPHLKAEAWTTLQALQKVLNPI